eukprot:353631-Chlamydomonas_euryale.AAC.1
MPGMQALVRQKSPSDRLSPESANGMCKGASTTYALAASKPAFCHAVGSIRLPDGARKPGPGPA